jgi:hypothetical protein
MLRALPLLLELALTIFCVIDCIQTEDGAVRNLPKWAWVLLVLLFPVVGPIAWLVAGRPGRAESGRHHVSGYPEYRRTRPVAPDDDPEFLRELGRVNDEHERTLRRWEADLARREEELRRRQEEPPA